MDKINSDNFVEMNAYTLEHRILVTGNTKANWESEKVVKNFHLLFTATGAVVTYLLLLRFQKGITGLDIAILRVCFCFRTVCNGNCDLNPVVMPRRNQIGFVRV